MSASHKSRARFQLFVCGGIVLYAFWLPAGSIPGLGSYQEGTVQVSKTGDREIVVAGTFAVLPQAFFESITEPEHLKRWMRAGGMSLADVHVDGRAGGSFRYLFQRPNGAKIEVRGQYRTFDPPRGFAYRESYDFSPLEIDVTTELEEVRGKNRFTQTLRYGSTRERDEDYEGVAQSSREAYLELARYLEPRKRERSYGGGSY